MSCNDNSQIQNMDQDPDLHYYTPLAYPSSSTSSMSFVTAATLNNNANEFSEEEISKIMESLQELGRTMAVEEDTEMYQQSHTSILQAIELNEDLQRKANIQVDFIDQLLQENEKNMKEAVYSALAESRFGQKVFIHKTYSQSIQYFDQSELLPKARNNDSITLYEETEGAEEVEEGGGLDEDEEEENVDSQPTLPNKSWNRAERERLLEGIRSEAKRGITYSYYKKNQIQRYWDVEKLTQAELESFPVTLINWETVSTTFVKTRTPNECAMQWTTQEHPLINKTPWSKQESEKLSHLVDEIGLNGQWERIAQDLNTNRTISQCFSHYMANKNNNAAKFLKWNPAEDKKLTDAVKIFGNCNWQQVAAMLKGRTGQQCLHRWTKSINPAIRRSKWTPEECKLLQRAVALYGEGNWKKVQRLIQGRTDMQCRERWVNIESPSLNKNKLTQQELELLVEKVNQVGPKWSYISNFFPGKTDSNVMKEYKAYISKQEKAIEAIEKERTKAESIQKKAEAKAKKAQEKEQALLEKQAKKAQKQVNEGESSSAEPKKKRRRKPKAAVAAEVVPQTVVVEEEASQTTQAESSQQPQSTTTKDKGKRKRKRSDTGDEIQEEDSTRTRTGTRTNTRYSLRASSKKEMWHEF